MKKTELVENVTAWTVGIDKADIDEQQLAIDLMKAGASMAQVNRELNKVLVSLDLKDDPAAARKAAEQEVEDSVDWGDYNTYEDVENFVQSLDCDEKDGWKAVKKLAKEEEVTLPSKPKLGKKKTGIVDYFTATDADEVSIKGLAEFLWDNNCCKTEEDALRESRMNFTFANQLVNINA